jgi:micrococcal nuclease
MRKRIVGGALLVAATLLTYQPQETIKEENKPVSYSNQNENQKNMSLSKVETNSTSQQLPITLVETIDGDTIKARVNGRVETIRYLLIDTPESRKPGMCIQPFAKEAFNRNNQLVKGGSLTMEFEEGSTRDAYGRLLVYVYVNGSSVQETLLKEGFARVAYIMNPPYKYLNLFRKDEGLAKRSQLNIWSQKDYVTNRGFNGCEF